MSNIENDNTLIINENSPVTYFVEISDKNEVITTSLVTETALVLSVQEQEDISVISNSTEVELTILSGAKGDQGESGYSGFSGFSGQSGYSGFSGYSGEKGQIGLSGYSGSGISGYSGYSGVSGYFGMSGYSGQSGISGYSGKPGPSNHQDLLNLDFENSGHIGFQKTLIWDEHFGAYLVNY